MVLPAGGVEKMRKGEVTLVLGGRSRYVTDEYRHVWCNTDNAHLATDADYAGSGKIPRGEADSLAVVTCTEQRSIQSLCAVSA